ncbi:hypothetical protein THIOSC15_2790008 [uncultured Thiomicrorhabdus sp.]
MSSQKWNLSALAVRQQSVTLYFIIVVALAGIYAFMQMGCAEAASSQLWRFRDAGAMAQTQSKLLIR